jgi:hypothetical protein
VVWPASLPFRRPYRYNIETLRKLVLTCSKLEAPMYIDPTTGSLVLQFIAAGVLSVLAMVSRVREALKSFFRMLVPRRRR